jgi:type IV pilus assembly protein PilV
MTKRNMKFKNKMSGFSMLEVLVSVFVLALGLLGLLNLQMVSLKNNHSAQMRTTATVLAYDILDRIRINKNEDYTLALAATPSGTTQKDKDLIAWTNEISIALPQGDGMIQVKGDIVEVTVQWNDSVGTEGTANQQFVVSSQP